MWRILFGAALGAALAFAAAAVSEHIGNQEELADAPPYGRNDPPAVNACGDPDAFPERSAQLRARMKAINRRADVEIRERQDEASGRRHAEILIKPGLWAGMDFRERAVLAGLAACGAGGARQWVDVTVRHSLGAEPVETFTAADRRRVYEAVEAALPNPLLEGQPPPPQR